MSIDQVFGASGLQISWEQECARALVIFVFGLVLVRLAGRRLFANWSALDIIVSIVTGSSLSRALTGNAELFGTLAAMALLFALHGVLTRACARWQPLSHALEGTPVVLAHDGRLDARMVARHGVSPTNVDEALHAAGLAELKDVRLLVLEPNGKLAVFKR